MKPKDGKASFPLGSGSISDNKLIENKKFPAKAQRKTAKG